LIISNDFVYISIIVYLFLNIDLFYSKKLDFSDDEDQINEKLKKQSLNGDIRSKSDAKGYSNKAVNSDPSLAQNVKVSKV
jgi:hypothetical protein